MFYNVQTKVGISNGVQFTHKPIQSNLVEKRKYDIIHSDHVEMCLNPKRGIFALVDKQTYRVAKHLNWSALATGYRKGDIIYGIAKVKLESGRITNLYLHQFVSGCGFCNERGSKMLVANHIVTEAATHGLDNRRQFIRVQQQRENLMQRRDSKTGAVGVNIHQRPDGMLIVSSSTTLTVGGKRAAIKVTTSKKNPSEQWIQSAIEQSKSYVEAALDLDAEEHNYGSVKEARAAIKAHAKQRRQPVESLLAFAA